MERRYGGAIGIRRHSSIHREDYPAYLGGAEIRKLPIVEKRPSLGTYDRRSATYFARQHRIAGFSADAAPQPRSGMTKPNTMRLNASIKAGSQARLKTPKAAVSTVRSRMFCAAAALSTFVSKLLFRVYASSTTVSIKIKYCFIFIV